MPAIRLQVSCEHIQQRCFACAVQTYNADAIAFADFQMRRSKQ